MFQCLRVDISYWHVMGDASDIKEYKRRTPELAV